MKIDNTISRIGKVKEKVNKRLIDDMAEMGLEGLVTSHGEILSQLFNNDEMPKSQIADNINRDRSTVTTLINKLVNYGYVKTRKNPEDSRSTLVSLTDKGKGLEKGVTDISIRLYETLFADIEDEEREVFKKVLDQMYENLSK